MNERVRERWRKFKSNKRGRYAFIAFCAVFVLSLCADFVANDKPLVVRYDGRWYFPIARNYPETAFGGKFKTATDYTDPYVRKKINEKGFFIMPPVPFSYDTVVYNLPTPAPSAPDSQNWLGTDDLGRDVLARLIYGTRSSLLFGLVLTLFSSVIGVLAGAIQGYFGGKIDLFAQRFLEIWGALPQLFVLIVVSAVVTPGFGRCCSCCCCFRGRLWCLSFAPNFCARAISITSKRLTRWAFRISSLFSDTFFRMPWWRR